ncbi:DeoR/GlpR family DNA-binding transcription regulator [Microbacterium gilvum]|uniref:DeoR/GlpR family DNA-binding transcription regulator n=1 Tax=Microbacterium gilvum TaxID=1336204 RepID=UPI0031F07B2D
MQEQERSLTAERKEHLLSAIASDGKVLAKEAARDLGVSEDTIRRDLRELAAAGLCRRVYGGALPVPAAQATYEERGSLNTAGKSRVAEAAAGLVRPGMTFVLDGGTTALRVARSLPDDLAATVVTHSPTVAVELLPKTGIEVVLIGGRLFRHSAVASGAAAVEAASQINADLFLMGVTGVSADFGLTTGDSDEAVVKRTFARRSAETFVLASSEKIGAASPFQVLPLSGVTGVVTDAEESSALDAISQRVRVIRA